MILDKFCNGLLCTLIYRPEMFINKDTCTCICKISSYHKATFDFICFAIKTRKLDKNWHINFWRKKICEIVALKWKKIAKSKACCSSVRTIKIKNKKMKCIMGHFWVQTKRILHDRSVINMSLTNMPLIRPRDNGRS